MSRRLPRGMKEHLAAPLRPPPAQGPEAEARWAEEREAFRKEQAHCLAALHRLRDEYGWTVLSMALGDLRGNPDAASPPRLEDVNGEMEGEHES